MVNQKRKLEEQGKIKMKEISIVDVENHISHILLFTPILSSNVTLPFIFGVHYICSSKKNLEQK